MITLEEARVKAATLDAADEIAGFRDRFVINDPDLIYMDGNSLGRLPKATRDLLHHHIDHLWGDRLARSWKEGNRTLQAEIGKKLAGVIGASPDEVIINDPTCINLYKVAAAAMQHQAPRRKIVTDDLNFPSDIYVFQGLVGSENIVVVNSADGLMGPVVGLEAALDEETAFISLSHTVFKSGYTYDMAAINKMAHAVGALVIWDMSHSVGSVPTMLNESNADLAVGCTYKYLNGGPGAPAFLYCRRDLQPLLNNPITGWFGHANRYDFDLDYAPSAGIRKFITGTPTILSIAAIEPGVDLTLEAGMDRIRTKSVALSEFFIELWEAWLAPLGFTLNSPRSSRWRGSHVSIGHDKAEVIDRALIKELKVIPDFRPPSNIRFGLAPLYTSFNDCLEAVARTKRVMDEQLYAKYEAVSAR